MKKDIKWLKEEISKLRGYTVITDGEGGEWEPVTTVLMEDIYELINQLGKLGVLSQEWIDEWAVPISEMSGIREYVSVENLQNMLVPKQEKVVVPRFVAEWLDDNIERYKTVYSFIISLVEVFGDTIPEKVWTYASENPDTMARAYLDGYTVEEEQRYYVVNNDNRVMLVRMMDGKTITEADPFKLEELYEGEKKSHRLTEQEIKVYDGRYWLFAVPVEELEEWIEK